jgi:hypothetical protein
MNRITLGSVIAAACAAAALAVPAGGAAAQQKPAQQADAGGAHPKSGYYRRAPQVRGFVLRRGGYSYSATDVINTYGHSRTLYGGVNSYRDPFSDRQTRNGPFDHGFFFDSGIGPRGGDSPYRN